MRALRLENLFVPTRLKATSSHAGEAAKPADEGTFEGKTLSFTNAAAGLLFRLYSGSTNWMPTDWESPSLKGTPPLDWFRRAMSLREPQNVGAALAGTRSLALLAPPGGGKSTLLKRIASVLARRDVPGLEELGLGQARWVPFLLRCRELGPRFSQPLTRSLYQLLDSAEREPSAGWQNAVTRALRTGQAIVLIDGLDEIADEGERSIFAEKLRTFLGNYPRARLIVTSREPGFRIVAGILAARCRAFEVAPLLDPDEAIPQLAFVAFAMMKSGKQQISECELKRLLLDAREQLPDILGYASFSVADFLQRVELRSSLLMQVGNVADRGRHEALYEFRHLTFQEYLAAYAAPERQVSGDAATADLGSLLSPHLFDPWWRETLPLAAVMADRRDAPLLVRAILNGLSSAEHRNDARDLICRCLVDEVRIPPELAKHALAAVARALPQGASGWTLTAIRTTFRELAASRYGSDLVRERAKLHIEAPAQVRLESLGAVAELASTSRGRLDAPLTPSTDIHEAVERLGLWSYWAPRGSKSSPARYADRAAQLETDLETIAQRFPELRDRVVDLSQAENAKRSAWLHVPGLPLGHALVRGRAAPALPLWCRYHLR